MIFRVLYYLRGCLSRELQRIALAFSFLLSQGMAKPTSYSVIPLKTSPAKPVAFNGNSAQTAIRPKIIPMDKVMLVSQSTEYEVDLKAIRHAGSDTTVIVCARWNP